MAPVSCPAKRGTSHLRTEIIADRESFALIAPEWERLLDALGECHPELQHGWLSAWWRHFADEQRVSVLLLRRRGELAAALPLRHTRGRVAGVPVRELRLLENNETTRGAVLMARDDEEAARTLMAAVLADPGWDRLYWRNLADPEGAPGLLASAARRAGLLVRVDSDLLVPKRSLSPTWNEFLGTLPAKYRKEVLRVERKARKHGGGTVLYQRSGPELDDALETVRRLAEVSWQHTEAGSSVASRPELWSFYRDISEWAAREGRLLLAICQIDGEPAGFDLCLRAGDTIHTLKSGFDPRFASFSPGRVSATAIVQHAISMGCHTLDFMGYLDDFKRRWGCYLDPEVALIATRRRPLPAAAHLLRHVIAPKLAHSAPLRPLVRWLRGRAGA